MLLEKNGKGIIINKTKARGDEKLNCKYVQEDKLLLLQITEEIDHHFVEEIRRKADYEITRYMPRKVIFDFNQVTFMDSAGIGMLIGRYKVAKMLGSTVEMINVKPSIKKVFEMSGVLKIVPIINSVNFNVS